MVSAMTNEEMLEDLKQFIATTVRMEVRNEVADLKTDVSGLKTDVTELKSDVKELKSDVTQLKSDVADLNLKMDTIADALTEDIRDHEQPITKLEQRAA